MKIILMEDLLQIQEVHQIAILMEYDLRKKESQYEENSYNDTTITEKLFSTEEILHYLNLHLVKLVFL